MAGCEVLEDEEMGEQVLHPRSDEDVAEDGKDLISVEHPFLLPEAVSLVESLDLVGDALRAGYDGLHLTDWRLGLLQIT